MIIILIGTNNLKILNDTPEDIANDIKEIINILLNKFQLTKIILRGLLPNGKYKTSINRIQNNKINNIICQYANNYNIFYIDNGKEFIDANEIIINKLLPDNIHLSEEGYNVLSKSLTPFIDNIVNINL